MPGLRHAHTLQQLRNINEYSPPGEYLINIYINNIKKYFVLKQRKQMTTIKEHTLLRKESMSLSSVVVVCEHGVSPAFKISSSSLFITQSIISKSSNLILQSSG